MQHDDNKPFMNVIDRVPVNIVTGDGSWLVDDQGTRYLDFWGDEGVASLGYGPNSPFFQALRTFAAEESLQRLPDMYHNPLRAEVAALLTARARYDRVFYCNSGAEGNEAAIKLARRYWSKVRNQHERYWVLTLEGNFHGRTGYALAASDSSDSLYHKQGYGPTAPGFGVIGDDLNIEEVKIWDAYNDDGDLDGLGEYKVAGFQDDDDGWANVAAITMAPILGNNVVKTYPKAFWDRLAVLQARHGFLIIFDEVQVGMGRTGHFCCHHHPTLTGGVRPDIVVLGKGIAMGLPSAAVLADDKVAAAFIPGVHFSTFGGTLLAGYMTRELIWWLDSNMGVVRAREEQVRTAFNKMVEDNLLDAYDGAGVHWGFTPNWHGNFHRITGPEFCQAARENQLLMCTHRPYGPIRFTPPLNIGMSELEFALDMLRKTAEKLHGV